MQPMFETLLDIVKEPLRTDRGVKTDNSILLVYPPDKELEFRDQLIDCFLPALEAQGSTFVPLDLTSFMFQGLSEDEVELLQEDEFDDYRWMIQGLSKRLESTLQARLKELAQLSEDDNIIVFSTVALYPMVRFGEILRGLRDLNARIVLAFPGEERGGKLHFMNQPDGGNYLAVKLFWR
jgi:hypothetical protein